MYIPGSFPIAVFLLLLVTLCWGSWANTIKLSTSYRYELFYFDFAVATLITSFLIAVTLGSLGSVGESFFQNLGAADFSHYLRALVGGAIFNVATFLLVTSITLIGISCGFVVSIGTSIIIGGLLNFLLQPIAQPFFLFLGILLTFSAIALIVSALFISKGSNKTTKKGVFFGIISGIFYSFFFGVFLSSMKGAHSLNPYSALFVLSVGLFICNLFLNYYFMKRPIKGKELEFNDYLKAGIKKHKWGLIGGFLWTLGTGFSLIAPLAAGYHVAYFFGELATVLAVTWGIFYWREFKLGKRLRPLITGMYVCYILALIFIAMAYS